MSSRREHRRRARRPAAKPVVLVSKCLRSAACRYDGRRVAPGGVGRLARHVTFLPVCPELELGLGVPRPPVRLVRSGGRLRLVEPVKGTDLTGAMRGFCRAFFRIHGSLGGAVLKSRSPSCGLAGVKVYGPDGTLSKETSSGFFAAACRRILRGAPVTAEEGLRTAAGRAAFLRRVRGGPGRACRR